MHYKHTTYTTHYYVIAYILIISVFVYIIYDILKVPPFVMVDESLENFQSL